MGVSTKYGNRVDVITSIAAGLADAGELTMYLELGVRNGKVFNHIAPIVKKRAYAVDISKNTYKTIKQNKNLYWFNGTTDAFFKQHKKDIKFNLVFIDADHKHESSLKDFQNVAPLVKPNGIIILHDTYPFSEKYFSPKKCADSYKTAWHIRQNYKDQFEIATLPMYLGLSIVRKADRQLMWLSKEKQ